MNGRSAGLPLRHIKVTNLPIVLVSLRPKGQGRIRRHEGSMYLQHFKLTQKPFELLPNPDFLFHSELHKKALVALEYGMQEHTGFILLTGEVGIGKTTLLRMLLDKAPESATIAMIFNTQLNSSQLLRMINDDFGIASQSSDKGDLLRDLNDFLIAQYSRNRRSILIIDEAQNLAPEQLEEIRLLSNLETAHSKLLQIILVGQPELRQRLHSPSLIQLRQRIMVHCHLLPLCADETAKYIFFRLQQAGNRDAVVWGPGTIERIHAVTRGIPRLINILCDYTLLDAYSTGTNLVSLESLEDILSHLDFEAQFWPSSPHAKGKLLTSEASPGSVPTGGEPVSEYAAALEAVRQAADEMRQNANIMLKSFHALSKMLNVVLEHYKDVRTKSGDAL